MKMFYRAGVSGHGRCDRVVMGLFLMSVAVAVLFFDASTSRESSALFPSTMKVDALFLMTSSHHQRRPPSSRAPGSGPSTAASPKPEPNTKRRRRESRAMSPLIVFYGMVVGRPGFSTENENDQKLSQETEPSNRYNDEFFEKDMVQQKQEFQKLYENFRGRGRWGGYSLVALQQDTQEPTRAPLPVIATTKPTSTPTSVAPAVRNSMKQRQQRWRSKRVEPMLQISDIQQYKDEVVDSTDSSLVVVRFYAPWCKACKAIENSYHRLPQEFPSSVKFVEVPLTKENAYLHKGLGVESLPFAHIYYNDNHIDNNGTGNSTSACRLVEELKIKKTRFSEFKRVIRSYVEKECDVHYQSEKTLDADVTAKSIPRRRQPNAHSGTDKTKVAFKP